MKTSTHFVNRTGQLTLLSGIIAFASVLLISLAVNFNFECFSNAALIFDGLQSAHITYFRWGMITDIWGFYLLFVPAVLYLHAKMESPFRHIYAVCGIAYSIIGAIGAAVLAATGTHFLWEYLGAETGHQAEMKSHFLLIFNMVNDGLWNLLEMGIFGVFMLGAAPVLRHKSKPLYWLTILLGIAGILDTLGHTIEVPILSDIGLNFYLFFEPVWAIVLGMLWMREKA